jgi:hypothetical protein
MIDWNILERIVENAFLDIVEEFEQLQINELEAEKWQWTNITKRKNGSIVGSPRDIVDTGELRDSLEIETITPTEVVYHYPVDHAIIVHQGATLNTGTRILARPWVDEAAEELKKSL